MNRTARRLVPALLLVVALAPSGAFAAAAKPSAAALASLVATGDRQAAQTEADEDLAPLRSDARFAVVVAHAARNAEPCAHRPESRQFDAEKQDGGGRWRQHRLAFLPLGPDRVRQLGEHSDAGGATWVVDDDLDYRRVK